MRRAFSGLLRLSGTVDRTTYAIVGLVGFGLKHNLDRIVATVGFHRPWDLFNYWIPVREVSRVTQLGHDTAVFLASMVALSLPFIYIGVVLTLKRLRSAGLPLHLLALFFVPFLNLLFFLILCIVPASDSANDQTSERRKPSLLARILPSDQFGSAMMALLITVPVGLGTAVLASRVLANYGWGLFVALPFSMGFVAALVYSMREQRTISACIGVACLAVTILGLLLLALAVEGLVCLIMVVPLALPLAAFGGICAYGIQKRRRHQQDTAILLSAFLLFAPGIEWIEHTTSPSSPTFVVHTQIDVKASPEKVWNEVIAFTEIPPPTEWLFEAGVAYPIRAEMIGSGVGAERHCIFSTGAFVEPIQVWDAPRLLKFSVTSNPAPLEEWTPYKHIDPPHLHGFLVSQGGQFLLTPLPDGGTRLEGTTWYRHGLWPAVYWRVWSDAIIHRIHLRVLQHIRDAAEGNGTPTLKDDSSQGAETMPAPAAN